MDLDSSIQKSAFVNEMQPPSLFGSLLQFTKSDAFTRKLHFKLARLEPSGIWDSSTSGMANGVQQTTTQDNSTTTQQQPQLNTDVDIYYDFDSLTSPPGSPVENILVNTLDGLESGCCSTSPVSSPDVQSVYYDVESPNSADSLNSDVQNVQITDPSSLPQTPLTPGTSFTREDSSDEESQSKTPIRSSSLKTGKTPPNTPSRKKIVRFADALGLDLAAVRTFLDEIPNVPKSAFSDLDYALEQQQQLQLQKTKTLLPTFHQPVSRPDFFDRIREQKVLLENAFLSDNFTIRGTVRVKNMDFHKSLYIRYTLDEWRTFVDFQATYVPGSCDGFSDKFDFAINLTPNQIEIGGKITFAARFHCLGQQFWDNNGGMNYVFHCVPAGGQQSYCIDDPWVHHMWL